MAQAGRHSFDQPRVTFATSCSLSGSEPGRILKRRAKTGRPTSASPILSGKEVVDDTFYLNIVCRQIVCAGVFEPCAMTVADMSCREQSNHGGACLTARDDAACTIFDDNAFARRYPDFGRRMQENVRVRLASRNVQSAEDAA